jgi:hypothetical protein
MTLILKKGASKKDIQQINKKLSEISSGKKLNTKKHSGVIKLKEDALSIQKKLRDEWE